MSQMPSQPQPPAANSLFRNIGQFVGHIAHAVKTDPTIPQTPAPTPAPVAVRTTVEEQVSPDGSLVLRRTTIDEIHTPTATSPARPQSAATSDPAP